MCCKGLLQIIHIVKVPSLTALDENIWDLCRIHANNKMGRFYLHTNILQKPLWLVAC